MNIFSHVTTNIYIYTYIPWIYLKLTSNMLYTCISYICPCIHLLHAHLPKGQPVWVRIFLSRTPGASEFLMSGIPKTTEMKRIPNHKLSVGPGFQRYAGKFLDCLYLQNENDEHRRFVWSCESFIFFSDFQRFAMFLVVLKESPAAASRCDGFCDSEVHWLEEELRQTRARRRKNR